MVSYTGRRYEVLTSSRDLLGEGLLWSAETNSLFWVDLLGERLHRLSFLDGSLDDWRMPGTIGWVVETDTRGQLLAGIGNAICSLQLDPFSIDKLVTPEPDLGNNRLNDAKADQAGRLWFGTMPIECDQPVGALYCMSADRGLERWDNGYRVTNGPAISPEGNVMYHTDSELGVIYRFDVTPEGIPESKRPHIFFEDGWGKPDGMTTDAEGGLWVAHWDGGCISRFDPQGRREQIVYLPTPRITNCTFWGPRS
jgi:D-xylonolactonase